MPPPPLVTCITNIQCKQECSARVVAVFLSDCSLQYQHIQFKLCLLVSKMQAVNLLHRQNPPVLNWRCRLMRVDLYIYTHTHPFNGPFSGTTWVSRYQKGKTNLDFTAARDSERQWHQLGLMQVCTSLQTDNHASTPPLRLTCIVAVKRWLLLSVSKCLLCMCVYTLLAAACHHLFSAAQSQLTYSTNSADAVSTVQFVSSGSVTGNFLLQLFTTCHRL